MKNLILLTIFFLLQISLRSQTYPFQDNKFDDEKRLDNIKCFKYNYNLSLF
jgi:hypothetical protein